MIETGLYAAFLTMFICYTIGKHGNSFNTHEIFSFYTVWLAKRRLRMLGLLDEYEKQAGFETLKKKYELIYRKHEFNKVLYDAAEPFFTWEKAAGMCSACTGFWIALFIGLPVSQNFFDLPVIVVISHIAIRVLNKFL